MPIFPSGQNIRLNPERLLDLLYRHGGPERDETLLEIREVSDLLPWISLGRMYSDLRTAPVYLIPGQADVSREAIVAGWVIEPLGCTLADWNDVASVWPEADRLAFQEYVRGPRFQKALAGHLADVVQARERIRPASAVEISDDPIPATFGSGLTPEVEARMHAGRKKRLEEEARLRAVIPFRWQDLPSDDYGTAIVEVQPGSVLRVGGKDASLRDLHQHFVYAGLLAGMPRDPEVVLFQALKLASRLFPWFDGKPYIVPPRIRFGTNREGLDREWIIVPQVGSIAVVKDEATLALIIWFQDRYGLPSDPRVLEALDAMRWEAHGVEWDP